MVAEGLQKDYIPDSFGAYRNGFLGASGSSDYRLRSMTVDRSWARRGWGSSVSCSV